MRLGPQCRRVGAVRLIRDSTRTLLLRHAVPGRPTARIGLSMGTRASLRKGPMANSTRAASWRPAVSWYYVERPVRWGRWQRVERYRTRSESENWLSEKG